MKVFRIILVLVAVLFGLLTLFAGTRVFLGADTGYEVYQPLLRFNTLMGGIYILAGLLALWRIKQGVQLAALIFALNLIALTTVFYLFKEGNIISIQSLAAMSFRTAAWLVLLIGFSWVASRYKA